MPGNAGFFTKKDGECMAPETDKDWRQEKISVTCCSQSGSASRPDCKSGVTFKQAQEHCQGKGLDLCTADQVPKAIGKGCGFDWFATWTLDTCQIPTPPPPPPTPSPPPAPDFPGWLGGAMKAACCKQHAHSVEAGAEGSFVATLGGGVTLGFGYDSGDFGNCLAKAQWYKSICLGGGVDLGVDAAVYNGWWFNFKDINGYSKVMSGNAAAIFGAGGGVILGTAGKGVIGAFHSLHVGVGVDVSVVECWADPISDEYHVTTNCFEDPEASGAAIGSLVAGHTGAVVGGAIGSGIEKLGEKGKEFGEKITDPDNWDPRNWR